MNNSFQTLELEAQNPNAYPFLPPIQPQTLRGQEYQRLTTSNRQSSRLASSRFLRQDSGPTISQAPLCDSRLRQLDISHWTHVPISNEVAARAISLYLETDHPFLGYFDPGLFISDLTGPKSDYCSPILVNALLYWACQMYSAVDPNTDAIAISFCTEAENLWETERKVDSILNLAAAQFLSLGYLGQGRDHAILSYLSEATNMAVRLGLFSMEDNGHSQLEIGNMTAEAVSAHLHAAWGSFNWIALMSLFYRQPGLQGPRHPPRLPIPEIASGDVTNTSRQPSPDFHRIDSQAQYMGGVFPYLCRFWGIMYEVNLAYDDEQSPLRSHGTLRFAEYKFRELLAWSNSLPTHLLRAEKNPHYVQVLQCYCTNVSMSLPLNIKNLRSQSFMEESACFLGNRTSFSIQSDLMGFNTQDNHIPILGYYDPSMTIGLPMLPEESQVLDDAEKYCQNDNATTEELFYPINACSDMSFTEICFQIPEPSYEQFIHQIGIEEQNVYLFEPGYSSQDVGLQESNPETLPYQFAHFEPQKPPHYPLEEHSRREEQRPEKKIQLTNYTRTHNHNEQAGKCKSNDAVEDQDACKRIHVDEVLASLRQMDHQVRAANREQMAAIARSSKVWGSSEKLP
ncbi:n-terminal fungal transcription regulatory domain-containing [Trichoderma arundinaceum]|uniref:N-terminal fungal transcription regulatory domain-containing n=1 Tax=Trichoderma arundinaceum TaxID=490622 RepID=A0A395NWD3_TRIAR|nr:n-terminal fungal transcription regulatory domain-containing [Trichoderma arundinaceum]